jgi:hypothetical protein
MISSSGTDESTEDESSSDDDSYNKSEKRKTLPKKQEPKFKPIGPDSNMAIADAKGNSSNE